MTQPPPPGRKLSELTPRCVKLATKKLPYGKDYVHACGIRTTHGGWPRPGPGETVLGRWHGGNGRLLIDLLADPSPTPYIRDGALGLLVTDLSLRGSFYESRGRESSLGIGKAVFSFYWPYSLVGTVDESHYRDNVRPHLMVDDALGDAHLGISEVTVPKGKKDDDFLAPVFSMRDRVEQLYEQVAAAKAAFDARQPGPPG